MRTHNLVLRCYAERTRGVWNAYCLDLSLVAQGESFDEVKAKLDAQIEEYVADAMGGQDKQHAVRLMTRRAPLSMWLGYYAMKTFIRLAKLLGFGPGDRKRFKEVMPLVPAHCH